MKKVPAIAFDFTGVFASSSKALPNSLQALSLLRKHNLPFVILTNAGGRTDSSRANLMSKLLNIPGELNDIINEDNVIQAHSPMRDIYHNQIKPEWNELVLIGGSGTEVNQVCDQWKFDRYITVEEMAAIRPEMVPLSYKAGFPSNTEEIKRRVAKRIMKMDDPHYWETHHEGGLLHGMLSEKKIKAIMVMSNPYMYETHMQIISDALISKDGILDNKRSPNDQQYASLFFSNEDLKVPFKDSELPHISSTLALGSFKRCFENIFFRQYSDPLYRSSYTYQLTGKPSSLAFSYAKSKLQHMATEKSELDLFMVGDTVESDIFGGNSNGFKTILVESGNYKKGDPIIQKEEYQPKYIAKDVLEAVEIILKNS